MSTHVRLYDNRADAIAVMERLLSAGIDEDSISVVSPGTGEASATDSVGAAATGAGVGAALGGGAGVLAGVGLIAIPGLGPVLATGWFASMLAGLATGAVLGGVTGGVVDLLTSAGATVDEAAVYAEAVRRGGSIITVRADDVDDDLIERVLDESGPVDLVERERLYREDGWDGYAESDQATPGTPKPPFI